MKLSLNRKRRDVPTNPASVLPAAQGGDGRPCPVPTWLRRLGLAGFLFFLIKGLAWLVVPALLAKGAFNAF